MNTKLLFIITLLGILTLLFLTTNQETHEGEISKIENTKNKISLHLKNHEGEFVLFTNKILNLKKGQLIKIKGKKEIYKNKKQIIVEKLFILPGNETQNN